MFMPVILVFFKIIVDDFTDKLMSVLVSSNNRDMSPTLERVLQNDSHKRVRILLNNVPDVLEELSSKVPWGVLLPSLLLSMVNSGLILDVYQNTIENVTGTVPSLVEVLKAMLYDITSLLRDDISTHDLINESVSESGNEFSFRLSHPIGEDLGEYADTAANVPEINRGDYILRDEYWSVAQQANAIPDHELQTRSLTDGGFLPDPASSFEFNDTDDEDAADVNRAAFQSLRSSVVFYALLIMKRKLLYGVVCNLFGA